MSQETDFLKWQLFELASQQESDIESNEIEILGETADGQEGFYTMKITEIAEKAHDLIKELELELGLIEIALKDKSALLESCEKALAERDGLSQ